YAPPGGFAGYQAGVYGPDDAAVGDEVAAGGDAAAPGGYSVVAPDLPPRYPEAAARQGVSADSLTADLLLPGRHSAPPPGWRRALFRVSGGLVRASQSAADQRRTVLVLR